MHDDKYMVEKINDGTNFVFDRDKHYEKALQSGFNKILRKL